MMMMNLLKNIFGRHSHLSDRIWMFTLVLIGFMTGSIVTNYALLGGEGSNDNRLTYEDVRRIVRHDVQKMMDSKMEIMEKKLLRPTTTSTSARRFPVTKTLSSKYRKRILVTGGAGFVGSHLVDRLMKEGHEVTVIDNFFTGRKKNLAQWIGHPNFHLLNHDVVEQFMLECDQIYHLACPASPPHYQYNPIKTVKTSVHGTLNMLGLAKRVKARILLTSTSEVYGDPQVHPQVETYWGNVNTIGPRACYDEGKRVAETIMFAYKHQENVDVRIARIFNTFGPRMHPNDGRVVSNFIMQALQNKPITIYGNGEQTRSFQYVSDLVDGLIKLMNSNYSYPVNIGNPDEYSIKQFAVEIKRLVGSRSDIVHLPRTKDDPSKRKPDISLAKKVLNWSPQVSVDEGLKNTIHYFSDELMELDGDLDVIGPAQ